jgi:hypothetical protein
MWLIPVLRESMERCMGTAGQRPAGPDKAGGNTALIIEIRAEFRKLQSAKRFALQA